MEQPYMSMKKTTNSSQQSHNTSDGPIAILWDMENCPVPSDVRPEDAAGNIRMALRVHPIINGVVTMFSAYGDFNGFTRRLREGCQRTGVKLIDVPNGRKDAADKAILVDMFLFALDNPPPSSIMLISGDVDFSPALHVLGQRGYTVILVIPSGVGVSSALSNAGNYVWDWPSVVRGEGFVPPLRYRDMGSSEVIGFMKGSQISDNTEAKNEEESIVYRGTSMVSHPSSEFNSSSILTSNSRSLSSGCSDLMLVQPGDLMGLKGQLVKLLESFGGGLPLGRLRGEYHRSFGRALTVSEYGASKLVNLLKKMNDVISVDGQGSKKLVYLKNRLKEVTINQNKKGKGVREENTGVVSSDTSSGDERVVIEEQDKKNDETLNEFRYELQEMLVSYSCRIFLGCFQAIYQQRYKRPLDYKKFGVNDLEELLEKVNEVVAVHEEPLSKKKFIVANGL